MAHKHGRGQYKAKKGHPGRGPKGRFAGKKGRK